jgi:hypothetical protein
MTRHPILLVLVAAACQGTTINTPVRSFDRPTDVALACVLLERDNGPNYQGVWSPHPIGDCSPDRKDQLKYPYVDQQLGTFQFITPQLRGFVTQSSRGELAEIDAELGVLLDYNRGVPGFNFIPTGSGSEHVRTATDGCRAFVTNPGSCDLASLDLSVLYNAPFLPFRDGGVPGFPDGKLPPGFGDDVVQRLSPSVRGRKLGGRPAWIEMAPENESAIHSGEPGGALGRCIGGTYRAWVAIPGCQLVAELDLTHPETGNAEVLQAIQITRTGPTPITDLSTLSCPDECNGEIVAPPASADMSAAVVDGGTRLPENQALPACLAIDFEGKTGRLVISDQSTTRLDVFPIDSAGIIGQPSSAQLTDSALGVSVVRVSPRTPAGKFIYAVARDGTVRVVDLDRGVECETHPDPRALSQLASFDPRTNAATFGCLPVGDPATPARSPLFTSPGIELANGALPRDVAFVHVDAINPTDPTLQPQPAGPLNFVGDFAWVIGSDGRAAAVNIFDACPAPNISQGTTGSYTPECSQNNVAPSRALAVLLPGRPQPLDFERLAHRQRPGAGRFVPPISCGDTAGAPRLSDESNPFSITVGNLGGGATQISIDAGTTTGLFPGLIPLPLAPQSVPPDVTQQIVCQPSQHSVGFQEIDRLRNETWTVAWEGVLAGTLRSSGRLNAGGVFTDAGAAWCSRGVVDGDKLYFNGCNDDTECDYTQLCFKDPGAPLAVTTGLCLERDDTQRAPQLNGCGPLLRGVRRFRIMSARQAGPAAGPLEDTLKLAEIYQPEYSVQTTVCDPTQADSCNSIQVQGLVSGAQTSLPTSCLLDADGVHRCLRACTPLSQTQVNVTDDQRRAAACGDGYQCAAVHSVAGGGSRCMRAPLDDALVTARSQGGFDCLREIQKYEIHSGEAFTVSGSVSGMLVTGEPDATGECRLPTTNTPYTRLRQSRLPLAPPDCFATPNHPVDETLLGPIVPPSAPQANACLFSESNGERRLHFENAFLAFGVQIPSAVPVPPERTVLSFIVVGGNFPLGAPLGVDVTAQDPIAAMVSPDRSSVFVVDRGKQSTAAGLRGQLIKLSTVGVGTDRSFIVR